MSERKGESLRSFARGKEIRETAARRPSRVIATLIIDIIPYRFPTIRCVIYAYINVIRSRARATLSFMARRRKSIKRRTETRVLSYSPVNAYAHTRTRTHTHAGVNRENRRDTTRSESNGRLHLHGARNVPRAGKSVLPRPPRCTSISESPLNFPARNSRMRRTRSRSWVCIGKN